jgi:hypothetical protein
MNTYIDGAFNLANITALMRSSSDVVAEVQTAAKYDHVAIDFLITLTEGLQLLSFGKQGSGLVKPAFAMLSRSFEIMQRAIVREDPYIAFMFPRVLYNCLRTGRPEIYAMVLQHAYQWSSVVLAKSHPLRRISSDLLAQMGTGESAKDALARLTWDMVRNILKTQEMAAYNLILFMGVPDKVGYLFDSTGLLQVEEETIRGYLAASRRLVSDFVKQESVLEGKQDPVPAEPRSKQITFRKEVRCMEGELNIFPGPVEGTDSSMIKSY